jgi:peroxiredoxin
VYTAAVRVGMAAGLLVAVALSTAGPAAATDPGTALELIRPGRVQPAKPFEVATPDSGPLRLADFKGKVVFVNFWATWCPPCKEEMPAMERLYRKYRERGLAVLAISLDSDGAAVVAPFVKEHGFSYPIGLDRTMAVANLYGVRVLPSSFIIDRNGNLAALALGPRDWNGADAHVFFESMLR